MNKQQIYDQGPNRHGGTPDNDIRKYALNNQWNLADLHCNPRKVEATTFVSERIKSETAGIVKKELPYPSQQTSIAPSLVGTRGKALRGRLQRSAATARTLHVKVVSSVLRFGANASNACGGNNHMRAEVCQKKALRKKKRSRKTHHVKEGAKEESTTEKDKIRIVHLNPVRVVGHVHRIPNARPSWKKVSKKYQVSVLLEEKSRRCSQIQAQT